MPYTVRFDPNSNSQQASIIPDASLVNDGVMTKVQAAKLDGITPGAAVSTVTGTAPITSTGGDTPAIGITPATSSAAGSMSAADKTKLDAIPTGGGPIDFAMFYGLTAGTGMSGTDYAATVAVRTTNGTGAVPFPQLGPTGALAGITALSSTTFNLETIGTYEVSFKVHTTEPGQLELVVNNTLLPETCFANMNPTAGGHPIGGSVYITTTIANSVLEVVNPNGNTPALTITPADGSRTHANAQTLTITRVR